MGERGRRYVHRVDFDERVNEVVSEQSPRLLIAL